MFAIIYPPQSFPYLGIIIQVNKWDICLYFDEKRRYFDKRRYLSRKILNLSYNSDIKVPIEALLTYPSSEVRSFAKDLLENKINLKSIKM